MSTAQLVLLGLSAWVLLCALLLAGWILLVELERSTRPRRRPGYIRPPRAASSVANRVDAYTTAATLAAAVNGSSSTPPGAVWVVPATPQTPPSASRTTAPGSSGNAPAVTNPGDNTTGAVERHACGRAGEHDYHSWLTLGTPYYCAGHPDYTISHTLPAMHVPEVGTWDADYPPWPA